MKNIRNVVADNMSKKNLFQRVKELKLPTGNYALFGSAPLCVRGLKDCHDLDIIVTEGLWNEYKKKNWETKISYYGSEYLENGGIELYKDWQPGLWNVKKLIQEAEIINGLPFVKLEKVFEWKKLSNRKKDLKDIKTIEKFLQLEK